MKTAKLKVSKGKKFKAIEKDAVDAPKFASKDIPWEGEELTAVSNTNIESDAGVGQEIVLRFFDFGANPAVFAVQQPTAQELFNSHLGGIESDLWKDGLKPFPEVQPRLMFSKDKTHYRFIIAAIPNRSNSFKGESKTLSQLLTNAKT